jgi:hypothetical protein
MKFTRQQLMDFQKGLNNVGNLQGAKFAYAVARNLAKIKTEIESIQKAFEAPEAYIEYDKARAELAKTNAVKDEKGNPRIEIEMGQQKYVIADQAKFDKELEELRAKHQPAVEARDRQVKEFEELLKGEVEIDLYTINPVLLPDTISGAQTDGIMPMIEEPGEKKVVN